MRFLIASLCASVVLTGSPARGAPFQEFHELRRISGAANDEFGADVGVYAVTAIVGNPGADDNGAGSGSVQLFNAITGRREARIVPGDGAPGDSFGIAVDVHATTAVVGAYRDEHGGIASGSAYLFDTETQGQLHKLVPDDASFFDEFGSAVAVHGTRALVGAPFDDDNGESSGAAYLFDTRTGQQIAKLLPDDGAALDNFGTAVALHARTAVVGSPSDDDNGNNSGAAYVFDSLTGVQIAKLLPVDGASFDAFGQSVGVHRTKIIVGAPGDDDQGSGSGAAYLFDLVTAAQAFKLLPHDGAASDSFGTSVDVHGRTAAVGAPGDDDQGSGSGSAYAFDSETGEEMHKLLPRVSAPSAGVGSSIALSSVFAIVGAPEGWIWQQGIAYEFIAEFGTPFCDQPAELADCPCGNAGAPLSGCDNSAATGGVRPRVTFYNPWGGNALIHTTGYPPTGKPLTIIMRTPALLPANGTSVFGDGLLCIPARDMTRMGMSLALGGASNHAIGHWQTPPGSFFYQVWYRDSADYCTPEQFNMSSGVQLDWP